MSEYQYYEFQTTDRFLNDAEYSRVKSLSSRNKVSRNQAIFVYNYGDFRYEPPREILATHLIHLLTKI